MRFTLPAVLTVAALMSSPASAQRGKNEETAPPITCTFELSFSITSASGYVASTIIFSAVNSLECPAGVTGIDVQRIIFNPYMGGAGTQNVSHYTALLSVAPTELDALTGTGLNAIGMVSDGTPESKLDVPFRVELSGPEYFRLTRSCTSGQSGLAVTCGGALLLTGTPAP